MAVTYNIYLGVWLRHKYFVIYIALAKNMLCKAANYPLNVLWLGYAPSPVYYQILYCIRLVTSFVNKLFIVGERHTIVPLNLASELIDLERVAVH